MIILTVAFNFTETATIYSVDLAAKSRKSKQIILTISSVVKLDLQITGFIS